MRKIAIKRLTASDLTFFKWHFKNHPAGKQKAINLNADVFVDLLYPGLRHTTLSQGKIPLDLHIFGPGLAGDYNVQRKIIKKPSYKNYRLDGEYIDDPEDLPDRFHILQEGDFVIFEFTGDPQPTSARAFFIAAEQQEDRKVHEALSRLFGKKSSRKSMIAMEPHQLEELIASLDLPENHPVNLLILEPVLEDIVHGGIEGIEKLKKSPYRGILDRETLEQTRTTAQLIGQIGEEIVFAFLETRRDAGEIQDFEWVAGENAISPFDFRIFEKDNRVILIDVKATSGPFTSPLHVSFNELLMMREAEDYRIYRLYRVSSEDMSARLRISENVHPLAVDLLRILEQLPEGVRPDGLSISPRILDFDEEIFIETESDKENRHLEE